jgi:hypothetical protein
MARSSALTDDDAVAEQLLPGWQADDSFEVFRTDVNKRVVHFTLTRPVVHDWPIGIMIRTALETMKRFIEQAGPTTLTDGEQRLGEITPVLDECGDLDQVKTGNGRHAYRPDQR